MKKIYTFSLIGLTFSFLTSKADYWTQKANFPGHKRTTPISFSYGDYGYIGWGTDTSNMSVKDLWAYNAFTNTWTQKATFPGAARSGSACFVNPISGKAYAGLGQNTAGTIYQDWWEYNIATNSWAVKQNFPGGGRSLAIGVFAGNYGYVGMGSGLTGGYNDLWLYEPVSNTWQSKPPLPSYDRKELSAFAIGSKAYFACGFSPSQNSSLIDLWEFDTSNDTWTARNPYFGDPREGCSAFALWGMGYVAIGKTILQVYANDMWVYDVINDTWYSRANFSGAGRFEAAAFAIHDSGYIVSGGSPGFFYGDNWKYTPDTITGINEFDAWSSGLKVFPNPAKDIITISPQSGTHKNIDLTIADLSGKEMYHQLLPADTKSQTTEINLKNFPSGIYFITAASGKQKTVRKFLKD